MDVDPIPDDGYCLCLFCRKAGHVVEDCPCYRKWLEKSERSDNASNDSDAEDGTDSTPPSPPFDPFPMPEGSTEVLCERCNKLEVLGKFEGHEPIVEEDLASGKNVSGSANDSEEEEKKKKKLFGRTSWKTTRIPPLGPVLSLRLLSTCPLCRLVFHASDLTDDEIGVLSIGGELVLVTGWSIHRLESDLSWKRYAKGKGPYAKCLYASVTGGQWGMGIFEPHKPVEDTVEAIGLIAEEGQPNGVPALGVRQVDPQTPDYNVIKGWLSRCNDLHSTTCRPLLSETLEEIKLVDVETRQIVMYSNGCDYVALSYVWGDVKQRGYRLGDTLPAVPATLEDAIVVTRKLDKRYLWADSLCIDQENDVEKDVQISRMGAIYGGAWATIFDLSGESACSGLPRVGRLRGVVPQLSWEVWDKEFLSVMPTLSRQMSWSHWATRAWTYQEGLLSPRRLFFTNHQVYFECNSVQCCESLNDARSPFHLESDEERRAALDVVVQDEAEPESVIGRGVLRDPFRPISSADGAQVDFDNFRMYLRLVNEFTARDVTHDADSLNAFSGVLMHLEEHCYKGGFLQGLPVDDLSRALSWFHLTPPRRRTGFFTWTWAGWEGEVSQVVVHGAELQDEVIMPPLRIWKAGKDGQPELVYNFNPTPHIEELEEGEEVEDEDEDSQDKTDEEETAESSEDSDSSVGSCSETSQVFSDESSFEGVDFSNDPVFRLAKAMLESPVALPKIDKDELLVEGIIVQLGAREAADYCSGSDADEEHWELSTVQLEGYSGSQEMRLYGYNVDEQAANDQLEFLLLSRRAADEEAGQGIYNALLSIELDGDTANRVGVASLKLDKVELLEKCKPERKLFKLR